MPESMTVTYSSSRREVWHWYWAQWRRSLWRYHLLFVSAIFAASFVIQRGAMTDRSLITAAALSLATLIFLIAFPQIMFKPRPRTLTIDANGMQTKIGKLERAVPWSTVARIETVGDAIHIVRTNLNAFIVPARAFQSRADQERFLALAQKWWAANKQ